MAMRLTVWAMKVANAEPAMPRRGAGPRPKMNTGFRLMSRPTESSMK
jgi:hypothetical protein